LTLLKLKKVDIVKQSIHAFLDFFFQRTKESEVSGMPMEGHIHDVFPWAVVDIF
jgi:hypothetical protein